MNRHIEAVSYVALLRHPGVLRVFTPSTIGRLFYATSSLSLLLAVQHATRSYAVAGAALGAYGLVSVTMPVKSRLIDRAGQRRVLPVLASVFAAVCVTIAVAATAGVSASLLYLGLSAAVGLAAPPLGPSMRALWAALTPERGHVNAHTASTAWSKRPSTRSDPYWSEPSSLSAPAPPP